MGKDGVMIFFHDREISIEIEEKISAGAIVYDIGITTSLTVNPQSFPFVAAF
jgi:hypothetical protein